MDRTLIVIPTESIALFAADMSIKFSLPMADAMVYATALEHHRRLVTNDTHFKKLYRVVFIS